MLFTIETDAVRLAWSASRGAEAGAAHEVEGAPLVVTPLAPPVVPIVEAMDALEAGLREETTYTVLLQAKTGAEVQLHHHDPVLLRGLHRSADCRAVHGTVRFGSQVGYSRFTVSVDGQAHLAFEVEVTPTKLGYRADYDALCADLETIATELATDYVQAAYQPARAKTRPAGPLTWMQLLHHLADDVEKALEHVAAQPHWGTYASKAEVRAERVRRPGAAVRRAIARGRGRGAWHASALKLPVPERLRSYQMQYGLDTPEHRWLRAALNQVQHELTAAHRAESRLPASPRRRQVQRDLRALSERVERLQALRPLVEATSLTLPPEPSLRLLSAPGYREAYRALVALRQSLSVGGGPFPLYLKNLHRIYEIWCFLTLARLTAELTGTPRAPQQLLRPERHGLRLRLRHGDPSSLHFTPTDGPTGRRLVLTYNPRFSGAGYLVPQQPDFLLTLHAPSGPVSFVFDAKYRLDASPGYQRRYGTPGPPTDALNDLHRYRDALPHVREAVALFPYREETPGSFTASRLGQSSTMLGVGALPLLPGATEHLRAWLAERLLL